MLRCALHDGLELLRSEMNRFELIKSYCAR